MLLTCTGIDSGIAIDRLSPDLPQGPYRLEFQVRSTSRGSGEVFFTLDPKTTLPKGEHIEFDVVHDNEWQQMAILLRTNQQARALRLDIGSAPGQVVIQDLKLCGGDGKELAKWPTK